MSAICCRAVFGQARHLGGTSSLGNVDLMRMVEAVLFVADGPVSIEELQQALEEAPEAILAVIDHIVELSAARGVTINRMGKRVRMVTVPEASEAVERYLGAGHSSKLSTAALETLAIIAYRQPVSRAQVEAIRGANSDGVIRTLVARSLVTPVGRLEQVGRPVLYGTSFDFLEYLGIQSLDELPLLPDALSDPRAAASVAKQSTPPRSRNPAENPPIGERSGKPDFFRARPP